MPLLKPRKFDERAIFMGDTQVPFHDKVALDVAIQFIKFYKPTHLFLMGDMIDLYTVSSYDRTKFREMQITDEISETIYVLGDIRKAAGGDCHIGYVKGNHEARMERYLVQKADRLIGIRALEIPALLRLKDFNIQYAPNGIDYHGFKVKHGKMVRSKAGYTAHGELAKNGISGASGHTHRLGQVYVRNAQGMTTWVETGCLCDLNPVYADYGEIMDWQHGFAYGMFRKHDDRFLVHTVPIVNGSVVFGDTEIVTSKVIPLRQAKKDIEYL